MSSTTSSSGRIILGLQGNYDQWERPYDHNWDEDTTAAYMDQVRERAQVMAKEILAQALAEAEQIRQAAEHEGLQNAQAVISTQLDQEKAKISAFLAALESSLKAEKEQVFATHKHVLFDILRLAFEKTLGIVLKTEQEQVLSNLLTEAIEQLHASSTITVYVASADAQLAQEQLAMLKTTLAQPPDLVVKIDPEQTLGGVRLECGDGVVDNTLSSRLEQVRQALDAAKDLA